MPIEFSVSDIIPASPQQIYDAGLDSEGHAQITGEQPAKISAKEGAEFSAWQPNPNWGQSLDCTPVVRQEN